MTLRIIGAGFGRTGTSSLKVALEQLGFRPCYHMLEVTARPEHAALWLAAEGGESIDWKNLLAGYAATVDWPACIFWRELLAQYPEARVILTVRDAAGWYASFRDTILARAESLPPIASPAIIALYELSKRLILQRTFRGAAGDERRAIEALEAHNAAVIATVEPQRLLVYDVADGWEPLCAFLGLPVPTDAFPHLNPREEFSAELRSRTTGERRRVTPTRS
jgi:Sulfotransferase domain